jgi:hypothetical protein
VAKRVWFQSVLVLSVLLSTASAALLAYGTDPYWAQFRHGLGLIVFTHRLQWVLATVSLLLCLAVVGLIVGGRRRVWWLIALGPVLALFVHRFVSNPMREYAIIENPPCVKADAAGAPNDSDSVVGVQFGDLYFAYAFEALYHAPVILQSSHEQRFILLWSAGANRAMAFKIDREIKQGELQIVSTPADALLVYNARLGQFINGLTGETTEHAKPTGFHAAVASQKMTWEQWRKLHPGTLVLPATERGPSAAILPRQPIPGLATTQPAIARIIFAPTTRPVAIPAESVGNEPANVSAGEIQLLLFRDKETGLLKAFDRRVQEDLFPMFRRKSDPKRPLVVLEDQDSGTEWSADGKGIEGPFKGEQLKPVAVEDDLCWGVMKHWYPDLQWVTPTQAGPGNFRNPRDARQRGGSGR